MILSCLIPLIKEPIMPTEPFEVCFQYLRPGEDLPNAGYELTDAGVAMTPGAHIPRVGEFIQIVTDKSAETYEVLAITTRIAMYPGQPPGWTPYITVGPITGEKKENLSVIRE
jgi:hypothetical protein